jgi:hypothetical protein
MVIPRMSGLVSGIALLATEDSIPRPWIAWTTAQRLDRGIQVGGDVAAPTTGLSFRSVLRNGARVMAMSRVSGGAVDRHQFDDRFGSRQIGEWNMATNLMPIRR